MKHMKQEHPWVEPSTLIETGWLYARYAHGKDVPAWLYHMLAHGRQQTDKCQLPVVVVPACGRDDSLVVMTLRDFLLWCHHYLVLNIPMAECSHNAYPSTEE